MKHYRMPVAPGTKVNWNIIKQVLPYLSQFKLGISIALILLLLAKLATIGMPFILKDLVNLLAAGDDTFFVPLWLLTPFALVVSYGLLRFASTLFGELRDTLFNRISERVIRRVGTKVFAHLLDLDFGFHLERKTGALARDIERGTSGISFLLRFLVFNILPTLFEIGLVIGILLFNYGLAFGLVTAIAVVSYILFSMFATNWRSQFIRKSNEADSSANARAVDSLLNYETVKYFNNERHEIEKYDQALAQWEKAKQQNRISLALLNSGQSLIISAAMVAMLLLAAIQVQEQLITIGDFVLINAFMMQLFMPLNFLGFVYREIRASLVNMEKLFSLLQVKPQISDAPSAKNININSCDITFSNVSFGYRSDRLVLKDISLSISNQSKVAIVGESGAGKSTITKLLFRLFDVSAGEITIDGHPIQAYSQDSLRSQMAIVPQDCVLFNASILENVRYGRPEATDTEVMQAIKLAHLDRLIDKLPEAEHTLVGERGLKLSGGEKQRVAIARALLKSPKLLIFDEATSALDSASEKAILNDMREVSRGITTIAIAHRLSTIADCDQIFVFDDGLLVESGTHDNLLAAKGHYHRLWQLQQKQV